MVFHGCVDGYSRTIIDLESLNNIRASSVLQLFQEGVRNFGYMLRQRGLNSCSVRTGRSIERLWAELNRVVSFHHSDLFTQNEFILDSLSELHMFSLHYIYLPLIQRAAREFRDQWPITVHRETHDTFTAVA